MEKQSLLIPKPEELKKKFLEDEDGEVRKTAEYVALFLIQNYKPNKNLYPLFPGGGIAVAEAVKEIFEKEGWKVQITYSQSESPSWSFTG